jgi:hypothetical protein
MKWLRCNDHGLDHFGMRAKKNACGKQSDDVVVSEFIGLLLHR